MSAHEPPTREKIVQLLRGFDVEPSATIHLSDADLRKKLFRALKCAQIAPPKSASSAIGLTSLKKFTGTTLETSIMSYSAFESATMKQNYDPETYLSLRGKIAAMCEDWYIERTERNYLFHD
ncbi:hypothetical protein SISSUDRAFT_362851 [Sistotremastrum suecicum HHB10207 ss-3]|uniref:Uncharacterized protein n=1 Tax=Sistotremastrum suecicum HHB10207 ss-3 TaxID=1314776 RepID=A0A165Z4W1_9AGAM|nr:hypothetical protein SISSUDRAFT_362851 [Sistotremastrum suecicum HHB10207 ss-3]